LQELARFIGFSERELRNLRYAGLPIIKFRHRIRFEPKAVKFWLRETALRDLALCHPAMKRRAGMRINSRQQITARIPTIEFTIGEFNLSVLA
jgi:hypothetical protein